MQYTPWKKSRTFGDNYGGSYGHRDEDNIRTRLHNFRCPGEFDEVPIVRVDNPSRDWFHPLNAEQVRYALNALPPDDHGDVTHVWLRRSGAVPGQRYDVATAIWGSGVSLVTLYPTRRSLIRDHGKQKPPQSSQRIYREYGARLKRRGRYWQTSWSLDGLRKFYLQEGLFDSVAGHSAYVWRDGRCNSAKAREERMQDWLYRRKPLADEVYDDLFG